MNRLLKLLLSGLFWPGLLSAAPLEYDFTAGAQGWAALRDISVQISREGLALHLAGPDPGMLGPVLPATGGQPLYAQFRLRSEVGGLAQVFYFQTRTSERDSFKFRLPTNQWADVCIPLPALLDGSRLRFDPPGTNGVCTLAWVKVGALGRDSLDGIRVTKDALVLSLPALVGETDLVELEPHQSLGDALTAPVAQHLKAGAPAQLNLPRWPEGAAKHDRLYSGFALIMTHPRLGRIPLGPVRHADDLTGVSEFNSPFPAAASKKGLQVQMLDDAIALGVKHAALNVNLTAMVDLSHNAANYEWQCDGETFHFNRGYVDHFPVKALNDAGATVTFILLAYRSGNAELDRRMLHPEHASPLPNHLAAFNTATAEGARQLKACLEFLAHRFSDPGSPQGRVANYIVGNEVTAHWQWYNLGPTDRDHVLTEYEKAVRLVHTAVRKYSPSSRVYLSLEHHWTTLNGGNAQHAIAGREFIDGFARLARMGGDYDWHLAYHPYPENLFQPRTWLDKSAKPDFDTPRITFKNLEQLTAYFQQPALFYRGAPRRIILSEQGFHSDNTPAGDTAQAAGYCYAWEKVARLEGIDAFILHRHVDNRGEGGLNLGLWKRQPDSDATPQTKRPIYEVFRAADTPEREKTFQFALPVIGITNWDEVMPSHPR